MIKTTLIWLCSLTLYTNLQAQELRGYKVSDKIKVDGEGGWDYLTVDEKNDRLFVSHATQVQVIDLKSKKVIGVIPDTKGVHGIALAEDLNKGFISNGKDTSVTIFDLKSLKVIGKVKVTGVNPDAILYDPFSKKVFVYNGRTANATVIDAKTDKVVETIPLQGKPEFSVTDGKGKVYVNIEDKNLLTVINATTLKVEKSWPLAPGDEPTGLAFNAEGKLLYAVCGNKLMMVINSENGQVYGKMEIGDGCDGVAFDPTSNIAFASNGEGTLTAVLAKNGNHIEVLGNLTTQKGARTIAVNTVTHKIYIPAAEYEPATEPQKEGQRQRPKIKPGSFVILEITPVP